MQITGADSSTKEFNETMNHKKQLLLISAMLLLLFQGAVAQDKDSTSTSEPIMMAVPPDDGGGGDPPADMAVPPQPVVTSNYCGEKTLSRPAGTSPETGVAWIWQLPGSTGEVDGSESSTLRTKVSGKYFLQAFRASSHEWGPKGPSLTITVRYVEAPDPANISVAVHGCSDATLTRTYPSGKDPDVTWYWQGTNSNGTDHSSGVGTSSYTAYSSDTYYIRAYNTSTGCWSSGSAAIEVQLIGKPGQPPAPTVTVDDGVMYMTRADPPHASGIYYHWQNSSGTDLGTAKTLQGDPSKTYYLLAYDTENDCWSDPVVAAVDPGDIPPTPSGLTASANPCGSKTLTVTPAPAGAFYTYYWQGKDANGHYTITGNTYSAPTTGTYYIRAKHNTKDIWGHPASIYVVVNPVPGPPTGGTTYKMGKQYVRFTATGGTGTYLWYTGASGGSPISTTPSTEIIQLISSTKTLYAASYGDGGCQSSRVAVTVNIYPSPVVQVTGQEEINFQQEWVELTTNTSYSSYQWYKNGAKITGATQRNYKATEMAYYQVEVTKSGISGKLKSDTYRVKSSLQTENKSYSIATDILRPGITTNDQISLLGSSEKQQHITYYNESGLPEEEISIGTSPTHKDIIQGHVYDNNGRETRVYLPYTYQDGTGMFQTNWQGKQLAFYSAANDAVANTANPYAEVQFEDSPFQRVLDQGSVGEAWQLGSGHTSTFDRQLNDGTENIREWRVDGGGMPVSDATYAAGMLTISTATDEQGISHTTYTAPEGYQVLQAGAENTKTYYVYNEKGLPVYVLQPELVAQMESSSNFIPTQQQLDQYAFCYRYDEKNRLAESKAPGADWVYTVYDDHDRVILTQSGEQRLNNEWNFVKYDILGRPVLTGIYSYLPATQVEMQQEVDDFYEAAETNSDAWYEERGSAVLGYTDQSFPKNVPESSYLTATYYDDYSFKSLAGFGSAFDYSGTALTSATDSHYNYDFPSAPFDRVKGKVTGGQVRVLDGGNTWLGSATYYNEDQQVAQQVTENYSGGIDRFSAIYNFTGNVLRTYTHYHKGSRDIGIAKRYVYDHAGRLIEGYHEIFDNGIGQGEVLLAQNVYNELGQLIEENLHVENNTAAQSVDYRYNIRGWLESINGSEANDNDSEPDYFSMDLFYNDPLNGVPAGN